MRDTTITLSIVLSFVSLCATGCKELECGEGTIERDGTCAPASLTIGAAMCGPFTELQGDRCVPQFPPTVCDPTTTTPTIDLETGVTTCIGTGGGGCDAPFACPTPTEANRLTVCGQLYDLETNARFQAAGAAGAACDATLAADGPCALAITAYDAVQFATNPLAATPLPVGEIYIDDCGRYRVVDIDTNNTSPFIGLGIDDAGMVPGPAGVTVTVGVATDKTSPVVTNFEAFVVNESTTQLWAASGGPSLAGGIYVASFRQHKLGPGVDRHAAQEGVTFAKAGVPVPNDDYYFAATETQHQTIDPLATATGLNGSVLVTNRSVAENPVFDGIGGLGAGCRWESHAAATLPNVVFVQIFRKADLLDSPGSCLD